MIKKDLIKNLILLFIFIFLMFFVVQFFSKENSSLKEVQEPLNNNSNEMKNVEIEILKEGTGEVSKVGDTLSVHYVGTFEDGEKFDSSVDRGEPFEFVLGANRVIQGWEQGMLGMKVGEKRKLFVPYELGYGEEGAYIIPPRTNLIFEVELLEIK
ncbi:MAG: FKBP-type peptidyl-prolyl cis-trans isomerase [Candidatus Pacebacteria bacterium]|nr:FKBP-type peptidyl-prolyl cis-trans isomerase [Candidatus Paceibacterota bacterium]